MYEKELNELCEKLGDELRRANSEVRSKDKLSAGDLEFIDKITHAMKSVKTILAMEGAYSNDNGYTHDSMSYAHGRDRVYPGGSYENDNSYARGRGTYAKRDAMGRYSSDSYGGYSRDDAKNNMLDELRELMQDAPDERTKQEFQRFMSKLEQM
jgi:hypothetical protein